MVRIACAKILKKRQVRGGWDKNRDSEMRMPDGQFKGHRCAVWNVVDLRIVEKPDLHLSTIPCLHDRAKMRPFDVDSMEYTLCRLKIRLHR